MGVKLAAYMIAVALCAAGCANAAPKLTREGAQIVVEGAAYRLSLTENTLDFMLSLKQADGTWGDIAKHPGAINFGRMAGDSSFTGNGARATVRIEERDGLVVIGRQAVVDPVQGVTMQVHYLCEDGGVLMGLQVTHPQGTVAGSDWAPPRIGLDPQAWDGYAFWAADGVRHEGQIAELKPQPGYAGVSPWGRNGDTVDRLSAQMPALIVTSGKRGAALGVVYVDYPGAWAGCSGFVQAYNNTSWYLYAGMSPAGRTVRWAWLAPFEQDQARQATLAADLAARGAQMVQSFTPIAPPVPAEWNRALPDFPAELRRTRPVEDINDAIVYTMNETTNNDYGVTLARKVGSDMLVRGWFKWNQRPPVDRWAPVVPQIHDMGALFGGGITCSALYDTENGITREQLLDMATRNPAGELVDAWGERGTRHGSLSCPRYIDYLLRWCKEQIDAGVDYLFMDEHTAALSGLEGYDDHSLADFRTYLLTVCATTKDWGPTDPRWKTELGVARDDPRICPDGTMNSFAYREHLRKLGLFEKPTDGANALGRFWGGFRSWRDDRAWKQLTDGIRAYAAAKGRRVLISANGIARYVDLQVLGVWGAWRTPGGHIDLSDNQIPYWRSLVVRGEATAGKKVPVVLFHDWGFGDPPFPWMAVAAAERDVWMRTRGAEIYAAGGFFAFPVLGPFGCDAGRDGTLGTIAQQSAFYRRNADLFLKGRYLCSDRLKGDADKLSLAAWWSDARQALAVHVINRDVREGVLMTREKATVRLPLGQLPTAAKVVSPDFEGERVASCRLVDGELEVTLPGLEAYSVVILTFATPPDAKALADPMRIGLSGRWDRPTRSEFQILPGGAVRDPGELNAFLQGMLHTELRNPPTFIANALKPGTLTVHVRAVATAGAKLQWSVDGEVAKTVDLPDKDGANDGNAAEYNQEITFAIPVGRHRLTLDNVGGDWATLTWVQVEGDFGE
jgi:hypothetical protein